MAEDIVHVPETPDAVPAAPRTVEELRAEQLAEWGEYVALGPIEIGGVRAFNRGEAVPKSHVEAGTVSADQVAKRSTKAGQAVRQ